MRQEHSAQEILQITFENHPKATISQQKFARLTRESNTQRKTNEKSKKIQKHSRRVAVGVRYFRQLASASSALLSGPYLPSYSSYQTFYPRQLFVSS
jgi:hypothetical protein